MKEDPANNCKNKCPNVERNKKNCPCTYEPCDRKGICCECLAYHRAQDEKPACMN